MNKKFISMIIAACFSLMILVSCESHKQKPDDAFERVKEVKMMSIDSNAIGHEIMHKLLEKNKNKGEWAKFMVETEKIIIKNENKIKKIKGTPSLKTILSKEVDSLEKENTDLRSQIATYNEEVLENWLKLKVKMDQDAK